jgi:hypothetical protein
LLPDKTYPYPDIFGCNRSSRESRQRKYRL